MDDAWALTLVNYLCMINRDISPYESMISLIVITYVVILFIWLKLRMKGNYQHKIQLSQYLIEAQIFESRLNNSALTTKEHDDWIDNVNQFLQHKLGKSYASRFKKYRGMAAYEDDTEQAKLSKSITGRICRLNDFIFELDLSRSRFGTYNIRQILAVFISLKNHIKRHIKFFIIFENS